MIFYKSGKAMATQSLTVHIFLEIKIGIYMMDFPCHNNKTFTSKYYEVACFYNNSEQAIFLLFYPR